MTELGMLDRLVGAIAWTLVHSLWQGFLVATGLAVALVGLRGKSARSRYGVACTALLVMALLAAATVLHQLSTGLPTAERPVGIVSAPAVSPGSPTVAALPVGPDPDLCTQHVKRPSPFRVHHGA